MSQFIEAAKKTLSQVFDDAYDYRIPYYQRPYSWDSEQAEALLQDLIDTANDLIPKLDPESNSDSTEGYFLGCLLLIKSEGKPSAAVVDGQQRLTTLTILLALLANRLGEDEKKAVMKRIWREEDKAMGFTKKPRLTIREQDNEFFKDMIQDVQIKELLTLTNKGLNDSRQKFRDNAKTLDEMIFKQIENSDKFDLMKFVNFLMAHCYLVIVSTPKEDSAFQLFEVLNNRGLSLEKSDILKSDVIKSVEQGEQKKYSTLWEEAEASVGRTKFAELFNHLFMIFFKDRPQKNLLKKFRDMIKKESGEHFINNVLTPYTKVFKYIIDKDFGNNSRKDPKINNLFHWLEKIENKDWLPAALMYLNLHQNSSDKVLWFFERLERLAGSFQVCGKNMNTRRDKYVELLKEIDASEGNPVKHIELSSDEITDVLKALDSQVYIKGRISRNKYLVQRLNSFMSDTLQKYNESATIEHVLPQNVKKGSQWEEWWPDEANRKEWENKFANLILLNKSKNSSASNAEFAEKKRIYTEGTDNLPAFALTLKVFAPDVVKWDEQHLIESQADLLQVFKKNWRLHDKNDHTRK